jgi:hypothetical protein
MGNGYLTSDCHFRIRDLKTRITHLCLDSTNGSSGFGTACWQPFMHPRVLCRKHMEMHAHVGFVNLLERTDCPSWSLDHLHKRSVWDPALKILDWKSWMRFMSRIQWIHWKYAGTLKRCTALRALDEHCNSLINRVKSYLFAPSLAR